MLLVLFLSLAARAADPAPPAEPAEPRTVRFPTVTEHVFGAVEVHARAEGPGHQLVPERRPGRFVPMTWVRQSFDDALVASVDRVR